MAPKQKMVGIAQNSSAANTKNKRSLLSKLKMKSSTTLGKTASTGGQKHAASKSHTQGPPPPASSSADEFIARGGRGIPSDSADATESPPQHDTRRHSGSFGGRARAANHSLSYVPETVDSAARAMANMSTESRPSDWDRHYATEEGYHQQMHPDEGYNHQVHPDRGNYNDDVGGNGFDDDYLRGADDTGGRAEQHQRSNTSRGMSSANHPKYQSDSHRSHPSAPQVNEYHESHDQYSDAQKNGVPLQVGGTDRNNSRSRATMPSEEGVRRLPGGHQGGHRHPSTGSENRFDTTREDRRPGRQQDRQRTGQSTENSSSRPSDHQQYQSRRSRSVEVESERDSVLEGTRRAPPDTRRKSQGDEYYPFNDADKGLRPNSRVKVKDMQLPQGEVTIIFTDVQGSTALWESCPSAMKNATDIHNIIMRQCYTDHTGYKIATEGDAFNLAFQHPADALAFALQAQLKLHKAKWPEAILKHPVGKDEPALKFRGLRVRFGIHHGKTSSRKHESTGRTVYLGEAVKIAKALAGLCYGGQILTTSETWMAVSGMAQERYLGRPQVLDCGEHLLIDAKPQQKRGESKRIMQLIPSELAFDFFAARGRSDVQGKDGKTSGFVIKDSSKVNGRLFPPIKSKRQLSTSFLNAPYGNGRVAICFVYTIGLKDDIVENQASNMAIIAKNLRNQLLWLDPPGYECHEDDGNWMLAFGRLADAVAFGLKLKKAIGSARDLKGTFDLANMFKVGIVSGPFTSMGPHKKTGMADYFGPSINRAARVTSNCKPGEVCVGIPLDSGDVASAPDFGQLIKVTTLGIKKLKGITLDFAIYSCKKIELPGK